MTEDSVRRPPLDVARLTDAPWPVEILAEAGSTNALLSDRARNGAAPQVLATEHQTAGRGRLGRTWETPDRAALTFSLLLRPTMEAQRWPWLPLYAGLAVADALPSTAQPAGRVDLKWPNDVLVDDLKLAGILVERVDTPTGAAAIVGIGINVSTTREELPVEMATSLALAGIEVDRTDLFRGVLDSLQRGYDAWLAAGDEWLRGRYTERCATIGREVRVALPGDVELTGRATGIDGSGRLLVESAAGEVAVGAGDVVHVRAATE